MSICIDWKLLQNLRSFNFGVFIIAKILPFSLIVSRFCVEELLRSFYAQIDVLFICQCGINRCQIVSAEDLIHWDRCHCVLLIDLHNVIYLKLLFLLQQWSSSADLASQFSK